MTDKAIERRANVRENEEVTLVALLNYMRGLDGRLRDHMESEEAGLVALRGDMQKLSSSVALILTAFPTVDDKPDIPGHLSDHETRMKDAKTWKRRIDKIKDEFWNIIAKGFAYGLIGIILFGARDMVTGLFHATPSQIEHRVENLK